MGEGYLKLAADGVWNVCKHEEAKRASFGKENVILVSAHEERTPFNPKIHQAVLTYIYSWPKSITHCYDEAKLAKAKEQLTAPPVQSDSDLPLPMPEHRYGHAY